MRSGPAVSMGLLLLGVGPRLAAAAVVIALLWLGFFWATGDLVSS